MAYPNDHPVWDAAVDSVVPTSTTGFSFAVGNGTTSFIYDDPGDYTRVTKSGAGSQFLILAAPATEAYGATTTGLFTLAIGGSTFTNRYYGLRIHNTTHGITNVRHLLRTGGLYDTTTLIAAFDATAFHDYEYTLTGPDWAFKVDGNTVASGSDAFDDPDPFGATFGWDIRLGSGDPANYDLKSYEAIFSPSTPFVPCDGSLFIPFKDWSLGATDGLAGIERSQLHAPGKDFENFKVLERWANMVGPRLCACEECNPPG